MLQSPNLSRLPRTTLHWAVSQTPVSVPPLSMDTFIERSNALLAARPESTRVSIRYTHVKVAHKEDTTVGGGRPGATVVKVYDPVSGALFKIRVSKANELSRILSSLGPKSIDMTKSLGDEQVTVRKRGLASLMADTEYPDEPAGKEEKEDQSKKDSKKKKPKKK